MSVTPIFDLMPAEMVEIEVPSYLADTTRAPHATPAVVSVEKSVLPDRVWLNVQPHLVNIVIGLNHAEATALAHGLINAVEAGRRATRPRADCE